MYLLFLKIIICSLLNHQLENIHNNLYLFCLYLLISQNNDSSSKIPNIYNIAKQSKKGIEYAVSLCDYTHPSNENVLSLTLNGNLFSILISFRQVTNRSRVFTFMSIFIFGILSSFTSIIIRRYYNLFSFTYR